MTLIVGCNYFCSISINMSTNTKVMHSYIVIIISSVRDEYYKLLKWEAVCATTCFRSVAAKSFHNIVMTVEIIIEDS